MIVKNKQLINRTLLIIFDEDYVMYTILVRRDQYDDIVNTIKKMHDRFFTSDKLQKKYGGYSAYLDSYLDKKDIIFVGYSELYLD